MILHAPAAGLGSAPEEHVEGRGPGFEGMDAVAAEGGDGDIGGVAAPGGGGAVIGLQNVGAPVLVVEHERPRIGGGGGPSPGVGVGGRSQGGLNSNPANRLGNAPGGDGGEGGGGGGGIGGGIQ